jgi:hypothetical protein
MAATCKSPIVCLQEHSWTFTDAQDEANKLQSKEGAGFVSAWPCACKSFSVEKQSQKGAGTHAGHEQSVDELSGQTHPPANLQAPSICNVLVQDSNPLPNPVNLIMTNVLVRRKPPNPANLSICIGVVKTRTRSYKLSNPKIMHWITVRIEPASYIQGEYPGHQCREGFVKE